MLTVTAPTVALSKILLSTSSVVGGNNVNGTAILTAAAPAGGALVLLASADPVTVQASVTVPAGSLSATFIISTSAVVGTTSGTITGSYGGASAFAVLSVTQPTVATAIFGVTGPRYSDTCELTTDGNTLNCTFNGINSTAPGNIVAWDWSWGVVGTPLTATTLGPVATGLNFSCNMLPPPPLPPGGEPWFYMTITLKIHDDQNHISAVTIDNGVRLLSQPGVCGY
jgi:hypothetical protein